MSANVSRGFLGAVLAQKLSGAGALATGTSAQQIIPVFSFEPRDPENVSYPPMVNKLGFQSVTVLGKRTPSFNVVTAAKSNWFTSTWLNSLIVTADTNGDTDVFAFSDDSNTGTTRIYDSARCAALSISGRNGGGPIGVEMGFLCKTGTGTSSFATTSASIGALISGAAVDMGSGPSAAYVRGWRLNIIRGLNYDMWCDNTQYPDDTSSGMLGGTITLEMSPKATTFPSTSTDAVIRVFSSIAATSALVTLTANVNLDEVYQSHVNALGNVVRTYTLLTRSTAAPIVIT